MDLRLVNVGDLCWSSILEDPVYSNDTSVIDYVIVCERRFPLISGFHIAWWRYWPFVWGIHRSPVKSPHKGQWRRALMFCFFICAWINGWVNNREAGDLRRHRAHYDVIIMEIFDPCYSDVHCPVKFLSTVDKWVKNVPGVDNVQSTNWHYKQHYQKWGHLWNRRWI